MKKQHSIIALLLISISLAFISCEKNVEPTPQKLTTKELLIGRWRIDSSIAPSINRYKIYGTRLVTANFYSSGSFTSYDEAIIEKTGNWMLSNNDTVLTINVDKPVLTFVHNVSFVNNSKLILTGYNDTAFVTDYFTKLN